jgi:hypothetical protein
MHAGLRAVLGFKANSGCFGTVRAFPRNIERRIFQFDEVDSEGLSPLCPMVSEEEPPKEIPGKTNESASIE